MPVQTTARAWQRVHDAVASRTSHLPPNSRGLLWAAGAGLLFSVLNALLRDISLTLDPFQSQFLRYLFGLAVLLPMIWHHGVAAYRPHRISGQFVRGALHTLGLCLWFIALPSTPQTTKPAHCQASGARQLSSASGRLNSETVIDCQTRMVPVVS